MTTAIDMTSPEDPKSDAQEAQRSPADAWRRTVLGGLAGVGLAALSTACAKKPEPAIWDEEVQLSDGRVIVVR